ncbi:hypothetical protein Vafri_7910 [Volvox africanus]|nr:hypothetical protein Vafri_7910 [Volvox africanus]
MIRNARHTRAPSTWKQYDPALRSFIEFCNKFQLPPIGTGPRMVAMFLTEKLNEAQARQIGPQLVEHHSAAISVLQELAGIPSPCASPLCSVVREAARRTLHGSQRECGVATPDEINQLIEYHLHEETPLLTRMIITCAVLAFAGLMRYNDLSHILVHRELLHIYRDRAEIYLFRSKTDQYCKGDIVTIGRIGGPHCPVSLLETLLSIRGYKR